MGAAGARVAPVSLWWPAGVERLRCLGGCRHVPVHRAIRLRPPQGRRRSRRVLGGCRVVRRFAGGAAARRPRCPGLARQPAELRSRPVPGGQSSSISGAAAVAGPWPAAPALTCLRTPLINLAAGMERLRTHPGTDRRAVAGGSRDMTLGLVCAQRHPERVPGMVLAAVTDRSHSRPGALRSAAPDRPVLVISDAGTRALPRPW